MMYRLIFVLTCMCIEQCVVAEVKKPRGVAISKASFYLPGQDFTCLDGSATIPFDWINDEYCDCQDGSDEPGTSACPNGFFHCTNAGHKPMNIPSSRVNDGICDCCDGSDEYGAIIQCSNQCKELGKAAREEQEVKRKLVEEGNLIYQDYMQQGQKAKIEKQERLQELEREKEEATARKDELDELKKEAEKPEREAKDRFREAWEADKEKRRTETEKSSLHDAFADLDVNDDGVVSATEMQLRQEFDIDSDGEVSIDEAKEYLEDNDEVDIGLFSESIWPNIKAIYVKYKPPSEQPDQEPDAQETTTMSPIDDVTPQVAPPIDPEEDLDEDDDEDDDDADDDELQKGDEDDVKKEDEEETMPPYDEDTKYFIDIADKARAVYITAEEKYRQVESEYNDIKKVLDLDLGPNNEFYPLLDQCYELTDREYVYRFCPFERATQRSKSGGSDTRLGSWGNWVGPDDDKYSIMKMEKGQNCWNGPDRSVNVVLHCGVHNMLLAASEPNRCEYEFQFNTPAACSKLPPPPPLDEAHDEL